MALALSSLALTLPATAEAHHAETVEASKP